MRVGSIAGGIIAGCEGDRRETVTQFVRTLSFSASGTVSRGYPGTGARSGGRESGGGGGLSRERKRNRLGSEKNHVVAWCLTFRILLKFVLSDEK